MRTGKITINNKQYTLCFSARVIRNCAEKFGGMDKIDEVMNANDETEAFDSAIWLLNQLMQAGEKYCKANGMDTEKTPNIDEMLDLMGIDDFKNMKKSIAESISNGTERNLEIEEKNAETTLAEKRK